MTVITGGLITLEYAAAGVKYPAATVGQGSYAARDADLTAYVQAATPVIENIIGAALSASRTVYFDGGVGLILLNNRIQSVTTVVENGITLSPSTDYVYETTTRTLYRGTGYNPYGYFAYGRGNIAVTYLAGYATVPLNVQLATRELVRFWIQQGNESQRPSYGDSVESSPFTPQGFAVPKRVIELLASERELGGFA